MFWRTFAATITLEAAYILCALIARDLFQDGQWGEVWILLAVGLASGLFIDLGIRWPSRKKRGYCSRAPR